MLITFAVNSCPIRDVTKERLKKVTLTLDTIAAIALLVIGALTAAGVIPLPASIGWGLVGAGAVYSATMLFFFLNMMSVNCAEKKVL